MVIPTAMSSEVLQELYGYQGRSGNDHGCTGQERLNKSAIWRGNAKNAERTRQA